MMKRSITSLVRMATGTQARWVGCQPSNRQRIYFANHTSNLDFLAIWSSLPEQMQNTTRPIAARDYWTTSPFRRYLAKKVFRAVLIERHCVTKSNHPLIPMIEALDQRQSLILFPEGGRTTTGEMRPFKSGLYHLVRERPSVECVPVFIENLNRILPKGEILPLPLICSVFFGKPLEASLHESKASFLQRARESIERLKS